MLLNKTHFMIQALLSRLI